MGSYHNEELDGAVNQGLFLSVAIETRDGAPESLHVLGLHGEAAHGADVGEALFGMVPHPCHDPLTGTADVLAQNSGGAFVVVVCLFVYCCCCCWWWLSLIHI